MAWKLVGSNDIHLRKPVDVNQVEDRWTGPVEVYLRLIRVLYVFYVTENVYSYE